MKLNINRNQVLIAIGVLSVEGPDVAAVAAWLAKSGIPHLEGVVHILGALSLALGGLALAWPRIRGLLAAGGLATPPGAQAPWDPKRDNVVPMPPPSEFPTPVNGIRRIGPSSAGPLRGGSGYGDKIGALLVLAGSLLLGSTAWAQTPVPLDCGPLGVAVNSLGICIVPSSAGGEVFNLKTGSATNIGLMLGVAALHQDNLQLGGGFYCGAALALSAPNGGMCAALFTIKNYGAAGGGFLVYHDSIANQYVWQGLLMYAGTLHFGGTPSTIAAAKAKVSAETGK